MFFLFRIEDKNNPLITEKAQNIMNCNKNGILCEKNQYLLYCNPKSRARYNIKITRSLVVLSCSLFLSTIVVIPVKDN